MSSIAKEFPRTHYYIDPLATFSPNDPDKKHPIYLIKPIPAKKHSPDTNMDKTIFVINSLFETLLTIVSLPGFALELLVVMLLAGGKK